MFYFDPTIIDRIARTRLSCPGQMICLDLNDYRMFVADCEAICAVRVKSGGQFQDFLSELRAELFNAQSAIDEPKGVMIHLLVHPETDVTMENYQALNKLVCEISGESANYKVGDASDGALPMGGMDIMVFISGD